MLTQETPTTQRLRRPPYFVYHTTRVIFHDGAKPWRHHLLRRTPFSQTSVPQQIARYELCVPALGPAVAAAVARVAVAARAQQLVTPIQVFVSLLRQRHTLYNITLDKAQSQPCPTSFRLDLFSHRPH